MKEELMADLKAAMIQKDSIKKDTIILLKSAIQQVEKDTQKELTIQEQEVIVAKEVKKRNEAIDAFTKASREDIVENLKKEIQILGKYLPEQLNEEQIKGIIEQSISKLGVNSPSEMGKVMQDIKEKIAGKADGKLVSQLVKEMLNK